MQTVHRVCTQGTSHTARIHYINLQCINVPDKYIPDDRSFSGMSCIDLGATMSCGRRASAKHTKKKEEAEDEKRESLKMNHLFAIALNILIILDLKFKNWLEQTHNHTQRRIRRY